MNNTQLKYAQARAKEIYKTRLDAIIAANTLPATLLTPDQKREALRNGEFTVTGNGSQAYYLRDFVVFPQERSVVINENAIQVQSAALKVRFDTLMDELVLGEEETALQFLRDF